MSRLTVRVDGLDDLERRLLRVRDALQGAALLTAVMAGTEYAREIAESLAPRQADAPRRGYHGAEYVLAAVRKATPTRAEGAVGAAKRAFWLNLQELGTIHAPAQPWLQPTFDTQRTAVEKLIREKLRRAIAVVASG